MRRTVRALSLATATGAALAALTPAVFAGAVPDDGTFRGAASHAPCPEPEEHEWEPDALEPVGPEAVVPRSTVLEGPDAEPDADLGSEDLEDPGGPEDPDGFEADIPAPEEPEGSGDSGESGDPGDLKGSGESGGSDPVGPGAEGSEGSGESGDPGEPKGSEDSRGSDPVGPGAVEPKALKPEPTAYKPSAPESGGSGATPCASAPVYRGVHAGGGGAFTDSVPALAAGGLLIAGAFAAAAHRLHRNRTTRTDG